MAQLSMERCAHCGRWLEGWARRDRRYCGGTCRSAASRARRGAKHGWGDAAARRARRQAARAVRAVAGQS